MLEPKVYRKTPSGAAWYCQKEQRSVSIRFICGGQNGKNFEYPTVPALLPEIGDDTLARFIPIYLKFRETFDWCIVTEVGQEYVLNARTVWPGSINHPFYTRVGEIAGTNWVEGGNVYTRVNDHGNVFVRTENGAERGKALPRFKCSLPTCTQATLFFKSNEAPFPWYTGAYCAFHSKLHKHSEVTVGKVYEASLPPDLKAHVQDILRDPNGMSVAEDLALAKALTATVIKSLTEEPDWQKNPKRAEFIIKLLGQVTDLAAKQSLISDKLESKLNYRQVLVLLSAAVEGVLRHVGNNADAKTILFTLLPELPWPAGVAKVNGAEGIIGSKGQLLLPTPPGEKEMKVAADFEGLHTEPRSEEGGTARVGKAVTQRELIEKEAAVTLWKSRLYGMSLRASIGYEDVPGDGFRLWEAPKPAPGAPDSDFRAPKPEDAFETM